MMLTIASSPYTISICFIFIANSNPDITYNNFTRVYNQRIILQTNSGSRCSLPGNGDTVMINT